MESWRIQKIFMYLAIAFLVIVAGILLLADAKSNRISIERTEEVHAPPAVVFALINDFHTWPKWAPQDQMDRSMNRSYSGAPHGKGAVSDWPSRGQAGAGRMEIIESAEPSAVIVQV